MILESDIEIKSMATVQEPQPDKGMTTLVFNPDNKVTTRVGDTFNTPLVLFVRADGKEFPCLAVLKTDKTFLALGNDSKAAAPEGFVNVAPISGPITTT
jgi:hypothetical protein